MDINIYGELTFSHIVNFPQLHQQIATARDSRNKAHIFLLITHVDGPAYKRNGLTGAWDRLDDGAERSIRNLLRLAGGRIARFNADSNSFLNN